MSGTTTLVWFRRDQQQRQQFGVAEARGAQFQQSFARSFVVGPVVNRSVWNHRLLPAA